MSPNGARVYVTGGGSLGMVSVIDTATNTVTASFSVGGSPFGIAVNPDGGTAYVSLGTGKVDVIDTATNTVTTTIDVGDAQNSITVSPTASTPM